MSPGKAPMGGDLESSREAVCAPSSYPSRVNGGLDLVFAFELVSSGSSSCGYKKKINGAVEWKENMCISPWPFRDRNVLLLVLLGHGRHVKGDVCFSAHADDVYMGHTSKGGRLSKGYPGKVGIQHRDHIKTSLRRIRIKLKFDHRPLVRIRKPEPPFPLTR